ncbi:MAG: rod shape-determining protein MreD [Acidimicrobiales bacterium]|jgi:rod shape-determining protein MreD
MTLRAWRRLFVVGFAVLILQVGIFQQVDIAGAHPDAFLLVAIAAGLVAGPQLGAIVGFVTGLVADLFVVTPFGLSSLCYVLVAFTVGLAASLPGGRAPHAFRLVATLVASIGGTLLYAGLAVLIGQPHIPRGELVNVLLVVGIANTILAVPAILALGWAFSGSAQARELATGGSAAR